MSNSNASSRLSQLASHLTPSNAPGQSPLVGQLLANQVSIITGSGQGIGRSAAILFAAHGSKVVVSDLDEKKAEAVAEEIRSAGGEAIAFAGNVMDEGFADRLIKTTVDKWGKINHIVNNAGFTNDKMLHNLDDATFRQMLECHTVAPFRIVRAAAPHMRIKEVSKRENRSIVNISSTSGTHGNVGQINYSAAKSAVVGMTKTIAKEWGPFGVRANTVAFGWIDTRLTQAKESGESIEIDGKKVALGIPGRPKGGDQPNVNATADIPLGRPGRTEEAAAGILFMASGLAGYVSGQLLEVTGGRMI
ncbi:unnamed protein product [Sympodiomycopsis kandeliae]